MSNVPSFCALFKGDFIHGPLLYYISSMNLAGTTALVTGAARRIGRATALALARSGADVVVHYRSSGSEAAELAAELEGLGVRSRAVSADLAGATAPEELMAAALEVTGRLDILVNSASIFEEARLAEVTREEFRRNFDINTYAPFALSRLLFDHLEDRGTEGVVVNFLDARIADYDRRHIAYAVSKRSLHTLTQMAAQEFAPHLRVNAVAPGLVLPPAGEDEGYLERLHTTNPLGTHGTLDQITDSVLFLVGNDFVTGQTIWVDGGRHLKGNFYG